MSVNKLKNIVNFFIVLFFNLIISILFINSLLYKSKIVIVHFFPKFF